jgi:SAM-dependent methyltransferase
LTSRLYTSDAELYDIAFSWDVSAEVEWLLQRLGRDCSPVLEPACGSGRVLAGLAKRGIEAVGIDSSPEMVRLARRRLKSLPGEAVVADMADFELNRAFGGAVCQVDSLAHLVDPRDAVAHLACVARQLRPGARYLVQLELRDPRDPWLGVRPSVWQAERDRTQLRITWRVEQIDLDAGTEIQHARFEVVDGRVFEERFTMAAWKPERWAAAVAEAGFDYAAVYDGDRPDRPRVALGKPGRLLWHELRRP